MRSLTSLLFSLSQILAVLFCSGFFTYQVWETLTYYLKKNTFQSSKAETYSGKWVTPSVTFCPDPPSPMAALLHEIWYPNLILILIKSFLCRFAGAENISLTPTVTLYRGNCVTLPSFAVENLSTIGYPVCLPKNKVIMVTV